MSLPTTDSTTTQVWMARGTQEPPFEEEFEPVKNEDDTAVGIPVKPISGGLWTSTYTPDRKYMCGWLRWCITNTWAGAGREAYLLEPEEDLNLLVVDSLDSLKRIAEEYSWVEGVVGITHYDHHFDFEAMESDGFDGIWLQEDGLRDVHLTGPGEPELYGWDAESILWFRFAFEDYEYLGKADDDGNLI